MVYFIAALVAAVLARPLTIGLLAILPCRSLSSSLSTLPEAAAAVVDVIDVVVVVVHILDGHQPQGEVPAAGGGGACQVLLCHHVVVVSAVCGCCAVKGGVPQIGVLLTITGQWTMKKRAADRANNNQPLHVKGGQVVLSNILPDLIGPAGKAPQARRTTTMEMNNNNKGAYHWLFLLFVPVIGGGVGCQQYNQPLTGAW